jgi:hypothetical protein
MGAVNCSNCSCNSEEANEMNGLLDKNIKKSSLSMKNQSTE